MIMKYIAIHWEKNRAHKVIFQYNCVKLLVFQND